MWVDCDHVICSEGWVADENGNCVPEPEPCDTNDPILDDETIQADFLNSVWGSTSSGIPIDDRKERGGYIVSKDGGYDIVYFPPTFTTDACGMYPPANWTSYIPDNVVGYVHSHPFYIGENTKGVCGDEGEESYQGGPSDPDYEFLMMLSNHLGEFTLTGFVLDGSKIYAYDYARNIIKYNRCGY
ncbi:MAG: hypothetical protein ACI9L9_000907 [Marivirga sp.]|jgi:hypothetical protein